MTSKKLKLNGNFTLKSTQTSSQKSTQQSKITPKRPKKSKFTQKRTNNLMLLKKGIQSKKDFFLSKKCLRVGSLQNIS